MRPFVYQQPRSVHDAVKLASLAAASDASAAVQFLAGGTTLIDLMKLDIMHPQMLVDITRCGADGLDRIEPTATGLRLGSLTRMAQAADHELVKRDYPLLSQSLLLAASPQLRNMARLGGNVLQRTRCTYFRDRSSPCNKREPGSGCSAAGGFNRMHALLGTSDACLASYAGDFAVALIALDATIELLGPQGARNIPFAGLHRLPGDTPHIETTLRAGELITALVIPKGPWTRRSLYLKIRDRQSYAFALASAAVALDVADGVVRQARIGLGGVATIPWRAREAEAALQGKPLDEAAAKHAAELAFANARTYEHNAFKLPLGKATLVRALLQAASLEG